MTPALRFSLFLTLVAGITLGGLDALHLKAEKTSPESAAADRSQDRRPNGFQATSSSSRQVLSLPSATNIDNLLLQYSRLSPQSLSKEITRLWEMPQTASRDLALSYLFRKLGTDSPEEGRRLLEDENSHCPDPFFTQLMTGWAETNLPEALSYLQSHAKERHDIGNVYEKLIRDFSLAEPDKALSWSASQPRQERALALPLVFESLIASFPQKTKAGLDLLTEEDRNDPKLSRTVIRNWTIADWPAAKSWMNSLSGQEKEQTMKYAFEILGTSDLKKATAEFHQLSEELKVCTAKGIVNSMWSQLPPSGMLDWLTDNMNDLVTVSQIAANIAENSDIPSSDLIPTILDMPAGHARDGALQGLSDRLCQEAQKSRTGSFTEALEIARKIEFAPRNRAAVKTVLNAWQESSPGQAKMWLENNGSLSPAEKQQYAKYLTPSEPEKN